MQKRWYNKIKTFNHLYEGASCGYTELLENPLPELSLKCLCY